MKRLNSKINKLINSKEEILKDLFFQSLPEETKRDFYKSMDTLKTFAHNMPIR